MSNLPAVVARRIKELEAEDPDALVAVFDAFGFYLYASPHHEPILGYRPEQLVEMNLAQIVVPADHGTVFMYRTIATIYTKPISFSAHLTARTGERVKLAGHLYHLQHEGTRYFFTRTRPDGQDSV